MSEHDKTSTHDILTKSLIDDKTDQSLDIPTIVMYCFAACLISFLLGWATGRAN